MFPSVNGDLAAGVDLWVAKFCADFTGYILFDLVIPELEIPELERGY